MACALPERRAGASKSRMRTPPYLCFASALLLGCVVSPATPTRASGVRSRPICHEHPQKARVALWDAPLVQHFNGAPAKSSVLVVAAPPGQTPRVLTECPIKGRYV